MVWFCCTYTVVTVEWCCEKLLTGYCFYVLRFLGRLLFVHGAWNHIRIANVILYSFYKNIVLYLHQLYYAAYNNWTGQVLFERWTIGTYNMFFTSIPPIAIGLFERVCSDNTRTTNPQLYKATQVRYQGQANLNWLKKWPHPVGKSPSEEGNFQV